MSSGRHRRARRARARAAGAPRHVLRRPLGARVRAVAGLTAATTATAVLACVGGLGTWALLPAVVGWETRVVVSGSMVPALAVGDLVVTAPPPGPVLPGHVVVFDEPGGTGRTVVHRVRSVRPDGALVTRGDANGSDDGAPLAPADVRGVARLRVPLVGLPAVWARQGEAGRLVAVVAAAVLLPVAATLPVPSSPERPRAERRAEAGGSAGRHRRRHGRRAPGPRRRADRP
ncbi:signal peptidase I [Cellulomonas marina]|uniref:Signal peptidase I n=1 Tax=Cellulomonas marina TaxID=988821 RepID=A0A1I0YUB5_9CELL|nr:signal peptidase I [Cellulomonas marina]GIG27514.1 hypothetical protein Cma02nite_01140 [Cellulomonas marina]SFB16577.1 signal peptidase, endoplasmic reticulum-type [Cellulomonas marina]